VLSNLCQRDYAGMSINVNICSAPTPCSDYTTTPYSDFKAARHGAARSTELPESPITETNTMQFVLFDTQNRTFGPYFVTTNTILIHSNDNFARSARTVTSKLPWKSSVCCSACTVSSVLCVPISEFGFAAQLNCGGAWQSIAEMNTTHKSYLAHTIGHWDFI
jgi:hypothetical protein